MTKIVNMAQVRHCVVLPGAQCKSPACGTHALSYRSGLCMAPAPLGVGPTSSGGLHTQRSGTLRPGPSHNLSGASPLLREETVRRNPEL